MVFETITLPFGQPSIVYTWHPRKGNTPNSPSANCRTFDSKVRAWRGSNPQPPDPQSGVLSIELQAHVRIVTLLRLIGKFSSIRSLLFDAVLYVDFPGGNVFVILLPIYLKRWFWAFHGKAKIWQLVF